jgi:hypothetical protein
MDHWLCGNDRAQLVRPDVAGASSIRFPAFETERSGNFRLRVGFPILRAHTSLYPERQKFHCFMQGVRDLFKIIIKYQEPVQNDVFCGVFYA